MEQALNVLSLLVSTDIPNDVMTKTVYKGELYWYNVTIHHNNLLNIIICSSQ